MPTHSDLPTRARLDKRLALIASLVRPGSRLADVGTDHAHLPVFLVQSGICPSAIATDIRPGPAARAAENIAAAHLQGQITVRLGDGLADVTSDEVEDIVIAGMGGETIAGIIAAAPWLTHPRYRLILQPMTKTELLHEFLLAGGWALRQEPVVEDGDRLYPVILAEYAPAAAKEQQALPAAAIRGAIHGKDSPAAARYLQKQRQRLLAVADALDQASRHPESVQNRRLAEELMAYL